MPCYLDGVLSIVDVLCTQSEYEKSKEAEYMSQHYLQSDFVESYLSQKGFKIRDLISLSSGLAETGEETGAIFETRNLRFITIDALKELLSVAKLDYNDFISAYSLHLKYL